MRKHNIFACILIESAFSCSVRFPFYFCFSLSLACLTIPFWSRCSLYAVFVRIALSLSWSPVSLSVWTGGRLLARSLTRCCVPVCSVRSLWLCATALSLPVSLLPALAQISAAAAQLELLFYRRQQPHSRSRWLWHSLSFRFVSFRTILSQCVCAACACACVYGMTVDTVILVRIALCFCQLPVALPRRLSSLCSFLCASPIIISPTCQTFLPR